jgi:DNA-directed RNA polymerase specialized sigma24 family protein
VSRLPRAARNLPASTVPGARARIAAALAALAGTDRLVLTLHLLEGLSALEIAGALQLKTREVEQRRRAALAAIARELGSTVHTRPGRARRSAA